MTSTRQASSRPSTIEPTILILLTLDHVCRPLRVFELSEGLSERDGFLLRHFSSACLRFFNRLERFRGFDEEMAGAHEVFAPVVVLSGDLSDTCRKRPARHVANHPRNLGRRPGSVKKPHPTFPGCVTWDRELQCSHAQN